MLYALINGIKSLALPKTVGVCQLCGDSLIAKCGAIKAWHWAHRKDVSCEAAYKPETEWHIKWKRIFGKDNCEIIIQRENIKHIADVRTVHGQIIEFQNSPMNIETLEARESFYGKDMIWIVNGTKFSTNFIVRPLDATEYDPDTDFFRSMAKMHQFTPNFKQPGDEYIERFEWLRPKQVWSYSHAKVLIDFGDKDLFLIKKGLGSTNGTGVKISKEKFISEHGGDVSMVASLITMF